MKIRSDDSWHVEQTLYYGVRYCCPHDQLKAVKCHYKDGFIVRNVIHRDLKLIKLVMKNKFYKYFN